MIRHSVTTKARILSRDFLISGKYTTKCLLIYIALLSLFCLPQAFAGQSVCPNGTGGVSQYSARGNPISGCLYFDSGTNTTQTEFDRIKDLFKTIPQQHIKIVNSSPEEMTASEKTVVNDAMAASQTLSIRTAAKSEFDGFADNPLFLRALADILKDEINILRKRDRDRSTDVAAATSLADLKTRWAARASLDDRTLSQLKTAIQDRVDSGNVDS